MESRLGEQGLAFDSNKFSCVVTGAKAEGM